MSQIGKPEIEELLSGYIDDELSERQRTEVKRLMRHDEVVAERLAQLQRQKQLLNSLPIAAAPKDMVDSVKTALERKLILDDYPEEFDESAGVRELLYRRFLTAAAMLIVPLGVLAVVIFNIIAPARQPQIEVAVVQPAPPIEPVQPKVAVSQPVVEEAVSMPETFTATLRLSTEQTIAVNGFIEKAIYENGLIDFTIPRRRLGESQYQITCPADRVASLLGGLEAVWERCEQKSLTIYGGTIASSTRIDNLTTGQLVAVFKHGKGSERTQIAKDFARVNDIVESMPGHSILYADSRAALAPSVPIKPQLTSGSTQPESSVDTTQPQTGDEVSLTITVTGL